MQQTLADAGLAAEMARLADALRARRPELDMASWPGETMTGDQPARPRGRHHRARRPGRPGRAGGRAAPGLPGRPARRHRRGRPSGGPPGRAAVDDMEALRQTERELERQGYLQRNAGKLELTPKAVRRLGETALRRVFADLPDGGYGDHEQRDAGQAGEYTGATRPWQFGDEQSIDAPATVRNALLRDASALRPPPAAAGQDLRPRGG